MTETSGGFRFVSHQRRGLIALPGVAAAGTVSVSATLSDSSTTTPVTIGLNTIADVQGIDTTLVLRQYPRPNATDAEPEFFPLVEFAAPELPWLLPTPDGAQGPLPWLRLVVVEQREGVSVTGSGLGRPDVLHIEGPAVPAQELPDPSDAALWAHAYAATSVQTTGSQDPADLSPGSALAGCRLVAPRRLLPDTSYTAALVPIFAASALAGLGRSDQEVAAALAAPAPNFAWATSDSSVDLPTYLHWDFSTGDGGDFESLARALVEVPVGPDFGTRPLDLGLAGAGIPETSTLGAIFRGALTAPGIADQVAWPDSSDADEGQVDDAVVAEIGAAAALTAAAESTTPQGRPAVGPMLYAGPAAGRGDVAATDPATYWFDQLNRDPRERSVAGIATRVLRRNVEDVMAAAWAQVGDVNAANAALQRLQASRAISASIHTRHLSGLSSGRLVSAARPLLGRVALPQNVTGGQATSDALAAVAASALPAGSTWRGVTTALRPGSRLGDQAGSAGSDPTSVAAVGPADAPGRVLTTLAAGLAEPAIVPDGTVGFAAPSAVFGASVGELLTDSVRAAASSAGFTVPAEGADAAAVAQGLDSITAGAAQLTLQAATGLAAQTSASITAVQLPPSVSFSQLGGVLMTQAQLTVTAAQSPVLVHSTAEEPHRAVLSPEVATSALAAVRDRAEQPAATLATAARGEPNLLPIQPPIGVVPIGQPPVVIHPVAPQPVVTPPPIVVAPPVINRPPIHLPPVIGTILDPPTGPPVVVQLPGTDQRLVQMRQAYITGVDRFVQPGQATTLPAAAGLDLDGARTALLAGLHPATTVATLAAARVPVIAGMVRPDPVAPIMAGPVFTDAAYTPLVQASHDAFVPGLDAIPPDSVTLVQTNPTFIAAYLAGLNSALGHELLWRGYPTDERGTYWHSFWGAATPDIGPLHLFQGSLPDNVTSGTQPLLVLILRGRLLKRYPDSDIYAVVAGTDPTGPELDDSSQFVRPIFRDFVDPDITLVGFPLTYDEVVGTTGGQGYWFVIAEHPGQPRFGLTDPDPTITHPPLPTWDELTWPDLGSTAATATYLPTTAPSMAPAGTTRHWSGSAADMAAITYQPAVRVAIRARDLLPSTAP